MTSLEDSKANIVFHLEGDAYRKAVVNLILAAEKSLTINVYIFKLDLFGLEVAEALTAKGKEGVKVTVVVDYIGSFKHLKALRKYFSGKENISFSVFNTLSFTTLLQAGRRLHQKIIISDASTIILGGINICDKKSAVLEVPRLDFAVEISNADFSDISAYCENVIGNHGNEFFPERTDPAYELISSNWVYNVCDISNSYVDNIIKAEESILLVHGYFFPSKHILDLLVQKASEGVVVEILIPKYSDWEKWNFAVRHLCKYLTSNNINVYEWPLSNLHGKLALFDKKIINLGSHNLNYMSRCGNLELNIVLHDDQLVDSIYRQYLKHIVDNSTLLSFKENYFELIRNRFLYGVVLGISFLSVKFIWLNRWMKKR